MTLKEELTKNMFEFYCGREDLVRSLIKKIKEGVNSCQKQSKYHTLSFDICIQLYPSYENHYYFRVEVKSEKLLIGPDFQKGNVYSYGDKTCSFIIPSSRSGKEVFLQFVEQRLAKEGLIVKRANNVLYADLILDIRLMGHFITNCGR